MVLGPGKGSSHPTTLVASYVEMNIAKCYSCTTGYFLPAMEARVTIRYSLFFDTKPIISFECGSGRQITGWLVANGYSLSITRKDISMTCKSRYYIPPFLVSFYGDLFPTIPTGSRERHQQSSVGRGRVKNSACRRRVHILRKHKVRRSTCTHSRLIGVASSDHDYDVVAGALQRKIARYVECSALS